MWRALVLGFSVALTASCASNGGGGSGRCTPGAERCACVDGECLGSLVCLSGICVDPTAGSDGGGVRMDGAVPRMDGGGPTDGRTREVGPVPDAFFAEDPPPSYCGPDGMMTPDPMPPGGTPECPDDKNREGCPCDTVGESAPCWPGLRVHRDRGICHDGTTVCEPYDEFGGRWGPCTGYVLPTEGVTRGPAACRCFSAGRWEIDNLSPCFVDYGSGRGVYAVSTFVGSGGTAQCPRSPGDSPPPRPEPGTVWSNNRLTVDCEGQFELCFTLKAGDSDAPTPADCTVVRVCTEGWYEPRDATVELPPLPAWTGSDPTCAARFRDSGGYGEMSVVGLSVECDPVDDGMGGEYVFNRVKYCPIDCPIGGGGRPECMGCMMGGSGSF